MLRKVILICLIAGLLNSFAHCQIGIGLRVGGGGFIGGTDVKRRRFLLGADGSARLLRRDKLFVGMGIYGEFSRWNYADAHDLRTILDLSPVFGLTLARGMTPIFGAGFTWGTANGDHGWFEYESSLRGFNIQSGFTFEEETHFDKLLLKYRYIFENRDTKHEYMVYMPYPRKYRCQSFDIVLSSGMKIGHLALEVGFQAEDWIYKSEYSDRWSTWFKDPEFNVFGRVGIAFW